MAIYLALAIQFKNALKPLIVLAAVPYGAVGALAALAIMGAPFGFMAFLGVISLVGVIVSHIIVLFDYIEEKNRHGEPFEQAILDAGIIRLRPVLITVGATVMALVPLAVHGGPLWEPMCYAQIGGLTAATMVTLVAGSGHVLDLRARPEGDSLARCVDCKTAAYQDEDRNMEVPSEIKALRGAGHSGDRSPGAVFLGPTRPGMLLDEAMQAGVTAATFNPIAHVDQAHDYSRTWIAE